MNILIVKTSAMGDVIQTLSILEYLRKKFPDARIDWVVESQSLSLLQSYPGLTHALEMRTKKWKKHLFSLSTYKEIGLFIKQLRSCRYDLLFDLQGNTKSAFVTGLARAKVKVGFDSSEVREKGNLLVTDKKIAIPSSLNVCLKYLALVQSYFKDTSPFVSQGVHLPLSLEEAERLQRALGSLSRSPKIMVCFGSKWKNKQLTPSTLLAFLEKVSSRYTPSFLFIFGNRVEQREAETLAGHFSSHSLSLGALSLPLWQALMWECDAVITVDSAALHLAGTTTTSSFSVFGPTVPAIYKPLGAQHIAYQGPCPYGRHFEARCPVLRTCPTGACIRALSADELFNRFERDFAVVQKWYKT